MILNARQLRRIREALQVAIDERLGIIDTYHTTWQNIPNAYRLPRVVAPKFRPLIERWERDVRAWKRVLRELDDSETKG